MAVTHLYVDPARAVAGAGTFADPYSNIATAMTAASGNADGSVLHLRRGRVFGSVGSSNRLSIQTYANAGLTVVGDFGDDVMPPTFFCGEYLDGTTGDPWVYHGSGVWKRTDVYSSNGSNAEFMRLFAGSAFNGSAVGGSLGTGYTLGQPLCRVQAAWNGVEADVLADMGAIGSNGVRRVWGHLVPGGSGTVGTLYIYTGSAVLDPVAFYGPLFRAGSNGISTAGAYGVKTGLWANNSSNVTIASCDSLCAYTGALLGVSSGSPRSNIELRDANIIASCSQGLLIQGAVGSELKDVRVTDVTVDSRSSLAEDWELSDKDATRKWLSARMDPINAGKSLSNCTFTRVRSLDGWHGNFFIGSQASADAGTTGNVQLFDCYASNRNINYGHAIAGNMAAGAVMRVHRFVAEDVPYFSSHSGGGKFQFFDSIFRRAKKPQAAYIGYGSINAIPGVFAYDAPAWGTLEAECMDFTRCTFLQPYGFAFTCDAATVPNDAIVLRDCVVVDTEHINNPDARALNTSTPTPGVSVVIRAGSPGPTIKCINTYWYTGLGASANIAIRGGVSTTPVALSTVLTGGTGATEADPKVDAYGRPVATSPLIAQAATNGLTRDAAGVYRDVVSAIGAYEYVTQRPSRALP